MLSRNRSLVVAVVALAAPLTGCLVATSNGAGGFGGTGTTGGTSSTQAATTATNATGVTAASVTSDATATGVTATGVTGASGSTGTGTTCTDPSGTGAPESRCTTMPNMPATCPGTSVAPQAVSVCARGYQIYRPGDWEGLEQCFEMIPAADACGSTMTNAVSMCIDQMYGSACNNTQAAMQCDAIAASCASGTNPDPTFKTDQCKADLVTFSSAGLNDYTNCINMQNAMSPPPACSTLHDTCFAQVRSY